jgi:hypothetical protein
VLIIIKHAGKTAIRRTNNNPSANRSAETEARHIGQLFAAQILSECKVQKADFKMAD